MIKIKYTKENWVALIGLCLIQGALLPSHFTGEFPPLSLPCLVFSGLLCYLYKALVDGDVVYIISNSIGLFLNGLMIGRIILS